MTDLSRLDTADNKYRDWLILSTKRPSDEIVWYASGFSGYTTNLLIAGRYTELEAKREEQRVPQHLLAVPIKDALSMATTWVTVDNGSGQMEKLRELLAYTGNT